MRTAAVVLAAGRSRRMGQPKAWLRLEGETLLARTVRLCREADINPPIVVVGTDGPESGLVSATEVRAALGAPPDLITAVGAPDASPIDSLRAGLTRVPADHAVLMWPVDCPFADATLLRQLTGALQDADRIVVPVAQRRRGHPVLFGPATLAELFLPEANEGARWVVRRRPERIIEVDAIDPRVAATLNTPEDAAALGILLAAGAGVDGPTGL